MTISLEGLNAATEPEKKLLWARAQRQDPDSGDRGRRSTKAPLVNYRELDLREGTYRYSG